MGSLAFREQGLEKNDYLKKLNELKYLLTNNEGYSAALLALFSNEGLHPPKNISKVFKYADEINKEYDFLFCGYDAISESELIEHYKNRDSWQSFFGMYKYDSDFKLAKDHVIGIGGGIEENKEKFTEVYNINRLVPLCEFQGAYIVIDLEITNFGALIIIVDSYDGSCLAPSLLDHINDLIKGLESDIYTIGPYGIVFPTTWYLRKRMQAGEQIRQGFLC